jgi:hypothetical protein
MYAGGVPAPEKRKNRRWRKALQPKLEIMGRTLPSRCDEKMGGTITF